MKKTALITLLFAALTTFAQTPAIQPQTLQLPDVSIRDFNYTFYPTADYRRMSATHVLDTLTRQFYVARDSAKQEIACVVEKVGDEITIRGLINPTQIFYRERVKFIGTTNDGSNCLVYTALSKDAEMLIVNPLLGFVVVQFKTCGKLATKIEDCDLNIHYFGNCPINKFSP